MNEDYVGFSTNVVCTDKFLAMPSTTQALYFHLSMSACNGIVNCARALVRGLGFVTNHDLDVLEANGYIEKTEDGYKIVHWKENMGIGEVSKKRNSYSYRQWRKAVIDRDKVCQICGSNKSLQAHHKKAFSLFPELRLSLENGITLCDKCHKNLHKGERECQKLNG